MNSELVNWCRNILFTEKTYAKLNNNVSFPDRELSVCPELKHL